MAVLACFIVAARRRWSGSGAAATVDDGTVDDGTVDDGTVEPAVGKRRRPVGDAGAPGDVVTPGAPA